MRDDIHSLFRAGDGPLVRGPYPADGSSWVEIESRPYEGRDVSSHVTDQVSVETLKKRTKGEKISFNVAIPDGTPLMMNDYVKFEGHAIIFAPAKRDMSNRSLNDLFEDADICIDNSNRDLEALDAGHVGSTVVIDNGSLIINGDLKYDDIWDRGLSYEGKLVRVDNGSVVIQVGGFEQVWPNPVRTGSDPNRLISLLQNPWCMQPLLTACSGFTTVLTQNYTSPLELFSIPWNRLGEFSGLVSELKDAFKCYVFHYDSVKDTPRGRIIQRYANASKNHPSNYAILPGRTPERIEVDGVQNVMTFYYSNPRLVLSRPYSDTTWDRVADRSRVFIFGDDSWREKSLQFFDQEYVFVHNAGIETASGRSRSRGILGKIFRIENARSILPRTIQELERNLTENRRRSKACNAFMSTYVSQRKYEEGTSGAFEFSRPFVVLCLERNLMTIRDKYSEYIPSLNNRLASNGYFGFSFIEFVEDMLMTDSLSTTDRAWIWLYCTSADDMDTKIYSVVYGASMSGQCDYSKLECPKDGTILESVRDISSKVMISFKILIDVANRNSEQAEMFWAIVRNFVTYSGLIAAGLAGQAAAASTATSLGGLTGFFSGIASSIAGGASFIAGLGAAISSIVSSITLIITFVVGNALLIISLLVAVCILLVLFAYMIVKSELELVGELSGPDRALYKKILWKDLDGAVEYVTDTGERIFVNEGNSQMVLDELQTKCRERKRKREEKGATLQLERMGTRFDESFLARQREIHGNPLDRHRERRLKQYMITRRLNMATYDTHTRLPRTHQVGDDHSSQLYPTGLPVGDDHSSQPGVPMGLPIGDGAVIGLMNTRGFSIKVVPKYGEVDLIKKHGDDNIAGILTKCTTSLNETSYTYDIEYIKEGDDRTFYARLVTRGKKQMNFPDTIGRSFEIAEDKSVDGETIFRIRTHYSSTIFILVDNTPIQMLEAGRFGVEFTPSTNMIAIWPYEKQTMPEYYKLNPHSYAPVREALISWGSSEGTPTVELVHVWGENERDAVILKQLNTPVKAIKKSKILSNLNKLRRLNFK